MKGKAEICRKTKETDIDISLSLYGTGEYEISTGVGFLDHMLTALAVHGGLDLKVKANGDLQVDCHHTVEDVGIVLGQAFSQALEDKGGICRFGTSFLPMDEALAFVTLDISGRPYLVFEADIKEQKLGDMDSVMLWEFFKAFSFNAGITLHAKIMYGTNGHHMAEALFKALARALREAVAPNAGGGVISSKGIL